MPIFNPKEIIEGKSSSGGSANNGQEYYLAPGYAPLVFENENGEQDNSAKGIAERKRLSEIRQKFSDADIASTRVELNKDNGKITVYAPDYVLNRDNFKEQIDSTLQSLSRAYKIDPATTFTDTDGSSKTIEDVLNTLNDPTSEQGLGQYTKAVQTMMKIENGFYDNEGKWHEGDRENYQISDDIKLDDNYFTLRNTIAAGDDLKDTTRQAIPKKLAEADFLRSLETYDSETGTAEYKDIMEHAWNRSEQSDEKLLGLRDALDEYFANSDYEDTDELARSVALYEFIYGTTPDVKFLKGAAYTVGSFAEGAGSYFVDLGGTVIGGAAFGAMAFGEWLGDRATALIGGETDETQTNSMWDWYTTMMDMWEEDKTERQEDRQFLSKPAAVAWTLGYDIAELVTLIAAGNKAEALIKGGLGALAGAASNAGAATATGVSLVNTYDAVYGGMKTIVSFTNPSTLGKFANLVAKVASNKGVSVVAGLVAESFAEAITGNPDKFYRVMTSGSLTDEAKAQLWEDFVGNSVGLVGGVAAGKALMKVGETAVGRAVSANISKGINKITGFLGSEWRQIVAKAHGASSVEEYIAKLRDGGNIRKADAVVEKVLINSARKAIGDNEWVHILGKNKDELLKAVEEVEENMHKYRALENAIDEMNRQGLGIASEWYSSGKYMDFEAASDALEELYENVYKLEKAGKISGIAGRKAAGLAISQATSNYVNALIRSDIVSNVIEVTHDTAKLKALNTELESLSGIIKAYEDSASPELVSAAKELSQKTKDFYKHANNLLLKEGLLNTAEIEDLRKSGIWGKDGELYAHFIRNKETGTALRPLKVSTINKDTIGDVDHYVFGSTDDFFDPLATSRVYMRRYADVKARQNVAKAFININGTTSKQLLDVAQTEAARIANKANISQSAKELGSAMKDMSEAARASGITELFSQQDTLEKGTKRAYNSAVAAEEKAADLSQAPLRDSRFKVTKQNKRSYAFAMSNDDVNDWWREHLKSKGYPENMSVVDYMTENAKTAPQSAKSYVKENYQLARMLRGEQMIIEGADAYEGEQELRRAAYGASRAIGGYTEDSTDFAQRANLDTIEPVSGKEIREAASEQIKNDPEALSDITRRDTGYTYDRDGNLVEESEAARKAREARMDRRAAERDPNAPKDFGTESYSGFYGEDGKWYDREKTREDLEFELSNARKRLDSLQARRDRWERNGWKDDYGKEVKKMQRNDKGKDIRGSSSLEKLDKQIADQKKVVNDTVKRISKAPSRADVERTATILGGNGGSRLEEGIEKAGEAKAAREAGKAGEVAQTSEAMAPTSDVDIEGTAEQYSDMIRRQNEIDSETIDVEMSPEQFAEWIGDLHKDAEGYAFMNEINPDFEMTLKRIIMGNEEGENFLRTNKIRKYNKDNKVGQAAARSIIKDGELDDLARELGMEAGKVSDTIEAGVEDFINKVSERPVTNKNFEALAKYYGLDDETAQRYFSLKMMNQGKSSLKKNLAEQFKKEMKELDPSGSAKKHDYIANRLANQYVERVSDEYYKMGVELQEYAPALVDQKGLYDEVKSISAQIKKYDEMDDVVAMQDNMGRVSFMQVDPLLADFLNHDSLSLPMTRMQKINYMLSKTFRLGTTAINLKSIVNQTFRDFGNAFVGGNFYRSAARSVSDMRSVLGDNIVDFIRNSDKQLADTIEEIAERTGRESSDVAYELIQKGGAAIAPTATETSVYKRAAKVDSALKAGQKARGIADITDVTYEGMGKAIDAVQDKLGKLNELREVGLRKGVYNNAFADAVKRGYSYENAKAYATFLMNNATTNFGRTTEMFANMQRTVPFLGAAINGTKSFYRLLAIDPVGVIGRLTGGIIIPMTYLTTKSLQNEEDRKLYKQVREYQKDSSIVFVMDGQVMSIPIPQELTAWVSIPRSMIETMYDANNHDFWQLAINDMLGVSPIDLKGFANIDAYMLSDGTSEDDFFVNNIEPGIARLFSQLAPVPQKAAMMYLTGIDPYTMKKIDRSYKEIDLDTGEAVTMGDYSSTLAKTISGFIEKYTAFDMSAPMAQKMLESIMGQAPVDYGSWLIDLGQAVVDKDKTLLSAVEGIAEQVADRATSPVTVNIYRTEAESAWKDAVSRFYQRREELMMSDEWQSYMTKRRNATTTEELEKLGQVRDNLVQSYYNDLKITVDNLQKKYGAEFTAEKYASVLSLATLYDIGADTTVVGQELLGDVYNDARAQAVSTMYTLGFTSPVDSSAFGYLKTEADGSVKVHYSTPMAILNMKNTVFRSDEFDRTNINSILESAGLDKGGEPYQEMQQKVNAIYAKGNLTSDDYDAINNIYKQWDARVIVALYPYISRRGIDAVLNDSATVDVLDDVVKVPSDFMKTKQGRYFSSPGLNKQRGYAKAYIEHVYNQLEGKN